MTLRRQMIALIVLPTLAIYIVILGVAMLHTYRESKADKFTSEVVSLRSSEV